MSIRSYSFIKLDFDDLQSEYDFAMFTNHFGIPENTFDPESVLEVQDHYKFWILDPITFNVVCTVSREEPNKITWCDSFEEESNNPPIKIFGDLELDTILDKIGLHGLSSLTMLEREFLQSQSNDSPNEEQKEYSFIRLNLELVNSKQDLIDFIVLNKIPENIIPVDMIIKNPNHFKYCILDGCTKDIIAFTVLSDPSRFFATDKFVEEVLSIPKDDFKI